MADPSPWERWRNLSFAAGAAVAVPFAAWDLYKWVEAYTSDHFHNDFTFYLAAARIGISHGWPSIYDLSLQQSELDAMGAEVAQTGSSARWGGAGSSTRTGSPGRT